MKGRAEKKRRKITLLQSEKFKRFLSMEIGIEIKACLYFSIILFYYFLHRVVQGSYAAGIPVMIEMVLTSYAMSYLQVYLLQNFDEAERFGAGVAGRSVFCTALYTVIAYLFRWFDGNLTVTFCFFPYMLITYLCVFLIYKLKRDIDTAQLNRELERFKSRRDKEEALMEKVQRTKRKEWTEKAEGMKEKECMEKAEGTVKIKDGKKEER